MVVAAPNEYRAVCEGVGAPISASPPYWTLLRLTSAAEVVLSGVGKANASGASARCYDKMRHGGLLSFGIAGALPILGPSGRRLRLGEVVAARTSIFADEGMRTPGGFTDIAAMGFPPGGFSGCAMPVDTKMLDVLGGVSDAVGGVATVSTCSGTDEQAAEVARRTGAIAECMEGAAVALAGQRMGVASGEIRVISNTTGDRSSQSWDLGGAFARLGEVAAALMGRWE